MNILTTNPARQVAFTRILVLAGIVLGYASYGTGKLGWGELFPFAHWRLYSAPLGINEPAQTFRVYVYDENTGTWQRRPLQPTDALTLKEQSYLLGYWARTVVADSTHAADAHERLGVAAASLVPGASRFRVVAETYYSLPIYEDPTRYDTSTVAEFTR